MNALKSQNEINAVYDGDDWSYSISETSKAKAKEILATVKDVLLGKIKNIKRKNKSLSLQALLKDIYLYYPDYAQKSIIYSDIVFEKLDPKDMLIVDESELVVAEPSEDPIVLKDKNAKRFLELISQ